MRRVNLFCVTATLMSLTTTGAMAQGWVTAEPLYGTQTLATGFLPDPVSVAVQAGGSESATVLGAPAECLGMITSAQPDVRVNFTAGSLPFAFLVNSAVDTTLVVNAPDGTWHCNDDSHGLNPAVSFATALSGQYDIWVGVYGGANVSPATLLVSERTPTAVTCGQNAQTLTGDAGTQILAVCPAGCGSASVWGTGIYSDDSGICTAAIHAGAIQPAMGGPVVVTITEGQNAYTPSTANGVTSSQWGQWNRSFTISTGASAAAPVAPSAIDVQCSTNAQTLPGEPGVTHRVRCPAGCTSNSVWGTGVYSDDSSVCTAAVHAGAINAATGGEVTVTIAPGQEAYPPSTANGVSTSEWGSWGRSFTVAP